MSKNLVLAANYDNFKEAFVRATTEQLIALRQFTDLNIEPSPPIEAQQIEILAYKKKWNNYFKMFTNNHDPYEKELHNIYKKELCFSPMPSLAIHTTNINSVYGMSPLLDYFKLWKANNFK